MSSYGDDKRRDIARSVLPSTSRKSARLAKREVHGRVRARVRDALRNWDDDTPDTTVDAQRVGRALGIKDVVRDRRSHDKLGPLLRWAEAKADDLGDTPAARLVALRAILPDGVIGWHAISHVEFLEPYRADPRWTSRGGPYPEYGTVAEHASVVRRLNEQLDRHGELNRLLKKHAPVCMVDGKNVCGPVRCWHGRHDTADFATWALDYRNGVRALVLEFAGC